eukprot:2017-Rhodomonas_salina.1
MLPETLMQPNQHCRELVPNHCECEMEANGCGKEAGDGGRRGWGMQGPGWRGRSVLLLGCEVASASAT